MGPSHAFFRLFLARHLVHHPHKADGVQNAQNQNLPIGLVWADARPWE
jgi:hypothetical protein